MTVEYEEHSQFIVKERLADISIFHYHLELFQIVHM
jgi:hypothetical protein